MNVNGLCISSNHCLLSVSCHCEVTAQLLCLKTEDGQSFPVRAQELCESRGGRPGLPVPNSPYGLCGLLTPCGNSGRLTWLRLQQPQEQRYTNSYQSVVAVFLCCRAMVWLPMWLSSVTTTWVFPPPPPHTHLLLRARIQSSETVHHCLLL